MTQEQLDYDKAAAYVSRSVLATFLTAIVVAYLMQSRFEKVSWEYDGDSKKWWLSLSKSVFLSVFFTLFLMWITEKEVPKKIISKVV